MPAVLATAHTTSSIWPPYQLCWGWSFWASWQPLSYGDQHLSDWICNMELVDTTGFFAVFPPDSSRTVIIFLLLLHWYPFHSLICHFCRTAFVSHCTKSVALLYSALSTFVILTFVNLLTSESTHHVLETKVKTRCKYCGVARATWSGGRIDIGECWVSALQLSARE